MKFHPLDWFSTEIPASRREALKMLAAGITVWVLAWLVVWWNQEAQRTALTQTDRQKSALAVFSEGSSGSQMAPKKAVEAVTGQSNGIETQARSLRNWVGTMIGFGLFWAGGILVFRPLTGWGLLGSWLIRCRTVERMSLVVAAALTLAAIIGHWLYSFFDAWMVAALLALVVLASAFRWRLPGSPNA